ncbi:MAG: alpha/beta hydrolase [Elusimicrobia bacterium]|nr:alpha/beta hydrolase [Elusimicrobiota bacterium]
MSASPGAHPHPVVYWLAGFFLLLIGLRWFERVNLYIPDRVLTAHPGSFGLKYEELHLRAVDGPLIHGWFVENEPGSPVILMCHGNAGNISYRLDKLRIFRRLGASVLLFDYRGYGRSTGSPTEAGTYRDAEAAYDWLASVKKVPPGRIILCGESLGNAVAIEMALRHKPRGLIVESAFTSTVDMGKLVFPWLPVEWMVKYRYDNLAKLPRVGCPVLVMHSRQDDIIPFTMGRRLFEAAREPKTFFEMRGNHNEGFLETGAAYVEALRDFLHGL